MERGKKQPQPESISNIPYTHFLVWFDRLKGQPGLRVHTLPTQGEDQQAVSKVKRAYSRVSTGAEKVYGFYPIAEIDTIDLNSLSNDKLIWSK